MVDLWRIGVFLGNVCSFWGTDQYLSVELCQLPSLYISYSNFMPSARLTCSYHDHFEMLVVKVCPFHKSNHSFGASRIFTFHLLVCWWNPHDFDFGARHWWSLPSVLRATSGVTFLESPLLPCSEPVVQGVWMDWEKHTKIWRYPPVIKNDNDKYSS